MYAENGLLVEFGQQLRWERERRGVPIETVCAITKVSARHMEALEAGHLEELPGGVFRKGIVRSYLAAVALEEAAWMERFETCLRASGTAAEQESGEWAEFAENVKRNRAAPGAPTGMRWLGVLLLFVLLLVCGWLAWHYVIRERLSVAFAPVPTTALPARERAG